MPTAQTLRYALARSLFGSVAARNPRAERPRALLGSGFLEDRLPPGEVFWSALDAAPDAPRMAASRPAPLAFQPRLGEPAAPAAGEFPLPRSSELVGAQRPARAVARPEGRVEFFAPAAVTPAAPRADAPAAPAAPVALTAMASPTRLAGAEGLRAPAGDIPAAVPNGLVSLQPPAATPPAETRTIESGAAPAATPATPAGPEAKGEAKGPPATRHYFAGAQEVGLAVRPDRVAVGSAPGAPAPTPAGLTFVRQVTQDVAVYEGPGAGSAESAAALAARPGVAFAVPVYLATETASEAVLLDEVVVALKPGVAAAAFFAASPQFSGYRPVDGTPDQFVATVAAGAGEPALAAANALAGDPRLQWASPNFYQDWQKYFTPNDPRFTNLWHLNNTGQAGGLPGADAHLPAAWDINPGGSANIVVAVVDDGVPTNHPDLLNWVNPGEVPGDGIDNDGNGYIDDINGWNFIGNNNQSGPNAATDEHGTAVAGVAAARGDNGVGVVGPAYKSPVMSVKIFEGSAGPSNAALASALYYAGGRTKDGLGTWKSADIVNNSYGGGPLDAGIQAALTFGTTQGRSGKGAAFFFASGNGFASAVSNPASYSASIPGVVAVGATNNKGERSDYSNYGTALDFVTPSNDTRAGYLAIDTTDRVGSPGYDPGDYTGTGANGFGGTSSATPLAVGIGALVLAQADALGVSLNPGQLRAMLRNDTDLIAGKSYDAATGKNIELGTGRLNAFTAVSSVGKAEISITSPTADLVSGAAVADFGGVLTGLGKSADLTFRVRNQGTSPLNLGGLSVAAGPFSVVAPPAAASLALGEATTFTLRFAPTAGGLFDGAVTLANGDADEGTFTFTARGTGLVASAAGFAFEDWNGNGVRDANDPALPGRVAYADLNSNGVRDLPASNTFGVAPALAIPDNATVTSNLVVSGLAGPVATATVKLNIAHTYDADLTVALFAPDGTRVELFSGVGGGGDNFTNTVLDDAAATPIASGSAPFTGTFRPSSPLGAFAGKAGEGTWKLAITDSATGDTGTLNNWSLTLGSGAFEPFAPVAPDGFYALVGLPNGQYPVRAELPAGWVATGGKSVAITGPNDANFGVDLGQAKNDRFYGYVFNDVNGDGAPTEGDAPRAGRTLFVDGNGNGVYDAPTPATYTATPALPIPDNKTVTSTLPVAGLAGPVASVTARLNISHTFDGDLTVNLIAPDNTTVRLFTRVGGSGDNFANTVFDDAAATPIAAGTPPFTGTFRPEGRLADFVGKAGNGTWQLAITDSAAGDTGTLNNWSLTISSSPDAARTTDALGDAFFDLPPGPATVGVIPVAGSSVTGPAGGTYTVTAAGAPIFERDFGVRAQVPLVSSAAINAGAAQRSRVTDLELTFATTLTAAEQAGMSYSLTRVRRPGGVADGATAIASTGPGPQVAVSYATVAGKTVATLTFTGADTAGVKFGSLADGVWRLTATSGTTAAYLSPTDLGKAGSVYRLFGDANGDKTVDLLDAAVYEPAFGSLAGGANYVAPLDSNADGAIDLLDAAAFEPNFGVFVS